MEEWIKHVEMELDFTWGHELGANVTKQLRKFQGMPGDPNLPGPGDYRCLDVTGGEGKKPGNSIPEIIQRHKKIIETIHSSALYGP